MKINLNSNFNLGSAFTEYVENKCQDSIVKFFDSVVNINVFISKTGRFFKASIMINDGMKRGVLIKSINESDNIYFAFDSALIKITKQLRKNKIKIRDYRKKMKDLKAQNSDLPYILASRQILKEDKQNEEEETILNVVEEKETEIEELTIEEALMKMDLINLPAYMFINKDNKTINVVYRREDGNISWINPKNK